MLSIPKILNSLNFTAHFTAHASDTDQPIRAEFFSAERLEQHAESLAAEQAVYATPRAGYNLAARVRENGRVLLTGYNAIAEAARQQRAITPAAEWLLDNFHVVENQLREIHDQLTPRFYRALPKLSGGPFINHPRVYGMVWAYIAHTDSNFDAPLLGRFLHAYQRVQPLTTAELWALPIILRCVMIENLRRLSVRVVNSQNHRLSADKFADELLALAGQAPQSVDAALQSAAGQTFAPAFAVQLVQRLHYQGFSLEWLNASLAAQGKSCDDVVQSEHAAQAAGNMTARNLITSMRAMSAFDWQPFFEEMSVVDATLRADPGFTAIDFISRDRYRHAIEDLAKGSERSELEIAQAIVAKISRAKDEGILGVRQRDIGYYLISSGRPEFEHEIGCRISLRQRFLRAYVAHSLSAYLGTISLLTLLFLALPLWISVQAGVSLLGLILLGVLGMFPASEIATTLVNRWVSRMIGPRYLPRLELLEGVPSALRTFVVVPTMLCDESAIARQVEQLEIHYLSNPAGDIRFALLSDWTDADTETRLDDAPLLEAAVAGIANLNARHGNAVDGGPRFFLFHRKRLWNESENKWIAWERKRGKLEEFNRLLRGATNTSFVAINSQAAYAPADVRYVITLDADTRLLIGAVYQLVGAAAHPLNRPQFNAKLGRVVEGYGILQPRITPMLPAAEERTVFQRIFSGPCGIDPYAGAISDVYQDLFGEGNFTGKGIYDVDAFEAALAGRVPENAVLSHDLFEGIFVRCGLVSDIEFFEEFPSHCEVAASRSHRWARGDWQLLPWIFGRVGKDIPALGRWKMINNLRNSLFAPALLFTLLVSWSLAAAPQGVWIAFVLFALAFPALLSVVQGLNMPRRDVSVRGHLRAVGHDILWGAAHVVIALTLLAHHAWLMLDAIVRTLIRISITHRNLLEWLTAAHAKGLANLSLGNFLWSLRSAAIVATAATIIVLVLNPNDFIVAAPFIVLWWASPLIARVISLPPPISDYAPLTPADASLLRLSGRRVWRFFTTFTRGEDHHLPPDNFQEDPHPVIAHRSSPTNFGLYLLSTVAARDFGWIGIREMTDWLAATLETLRGLPRYRGHFYNWYDTRELRVLDPPYISSVDSGNLAGHLLALARACDEIINQPVFTIKNLHGIRDSVLLLREAIQKVADDRRTLTVNLSQLSDGLNDIEELLATEPPTPSAWSMRWHDLKNDAETLVDIAQTFAEERGDAGHSEILAWAKAIQLDIASHARDLSLLPLAVDSLGNTLSESSHKTWRPILRGELPTHIPLADTAQRCYSAVQSLSHQLSESDTPVGLISALQHSAEVSQALLDRLHKLSGEARQLFQEMDFSFLFDQSRNLFSIGYRVAESALDESYYDLLASEARLTSFIAIMKGDVPPSHWFRLGRTMTPVADCAALVSWSGSMFEYLMPSLVMQAPRHSLLDETCRLAVQLQIEYGKRRKVPWGISESAYNMRDRAFTYQYSAFGVPELGLKRGLAQDLVIAPYASGLAAMYDAPAAARNFKKLEAIGARGLYGFFEAIDFTPARLPENQEAVVVRAYMAHHQGMTLVSLANTLLDNIMRQRFHREPAVQAAELLLQERPPREIPVPTPRSNQSQLAHVREAMPSVLRQFHSANLAIPTSHLLSNGRYTVMVTAAGSGYSTCDDLAVTRWREDVTQDIWGSYFFLRDVVDGKVWSAAYQPMAGEPHQYEVIFSEDRARIIRSQGSLTTAMEILVSPEDNAEIRRLSITNSGQRIREIEITSYSEVVLAPAAADLAHPAFSNLFVQTEYIAEVRGLIAARRPRKSTDASVFAAHVVATNSAGSIEYETDRARFLGRGHTIRNPVAVMDGRPLSNTVGSVLDPIFSLRTRVSVAPGATVHIGFATMLAATREEIIDLADKYHDPSSFERISTLAWTQARVQLHHLGIGPDEAHLFQYLANRVLYSDPVMRPTGDVLKRNRLPVTALWGHRISGDLPIILLRIEDAEEREIFRQLLRAHEYWRSKRLAVDLVILNEKKASYGQELQNYLEGAVHASTILSLHPTQRGGIFVVRADLLTQEEMELIQCAARAVVVGKQGSLAEQVMRMRRVKPSVTPPAWRLPPARTKNDIALAAPALEFFNGLGGFSENGREYVTVLAKGQRTPAPWINVIANADFGFQVSESGSGYTWSSNSRENQLTPWSNDPVSDPSGEAFYIRDDDTGELWTPTALPIRIENANYIAHHGQGYSIFQHASHGIASELLQFVSWDDPVKISTLTLENRSSRTRHLTITAYVEWVLGPSRAANAPFIITEIDSASGAMFAHNPWNSEFGTRIAFADFSGKQSAWTGDRIEFIGRNQGLSQPAALVTGATLSNRVGADLDPCCTLQTVVVLAPNESVHLTFQLGQAQDKDAARELVQRYRSSDPHSILSKVTEKWDEILTKVQVETPERSMDLMLNRWLLYQSLVCRMWARAAFYQAGGAYGFRDQLQDCMGLSIACPALARAHILRAAARQFVEGDVQHWWHPPTGRGVRTHISDDLLWLPYVVAHYVSVTGDHGVLDESIPFLEGALLTTEQEDAYFTPAVAPQPGTLYDHCARALEHSLNTGVHGLPLMGGGDWNDGMNRVGHEGKGESVWLGWFLHAALSSFAPLAIKRGEQAHNERWSKHAIALQTALEANAWDGAWYRRAYFDDGTPLGTASASECRIDSLSQSWAVISGAADKARALQAMHSVERYLIRTGDDLVLLFTPPFDKTPLDPGYIKGYLPGVRENGGQYTHAATWCLIAYAALGDGDKAGELFKMLNPINRASTRAGVHAYKVEPYVVAADVYAEPPHVRRGGWTWYTGAAGWLYRGGTEWILGLTKHGDTLLFDPCIPREWPGFKIVYRHGTSRYEINVENPHGFTRGVINLELDGRSLPLGDAVPLLDDGTTHQVRIVLGETPASPVVSAQ